MVGTTMSEPDAVHLVLTRKQVAERLQVPVDTVENLHRTGQLRGVKVGKHKRWRPTDVETFVQQLGSKHVETGRQNR